mgnify:CR=1 FL=1
MVKDKYSALWISHSSITDWLACPRAYYLKNIYKNPKTKRKISLISPPLALGQAVHEVIEGLSVLSIERRFANHLTEKLETAWKKISGKRGGFITPEEEAKYQQRAREMLIRIEKHPGILTNLAVKIKMELPYYWLSEKENIILCGKIDWLEYLKEEDAVHIIDFKTGKNEEREDSLQLPIYYLLATNTQSRPVKKISYWYIDRDNEPIKKRLPNPKEAEEKVLKIAKEIKLAKQLNRFKCPNNGCRFCREMEMAAKGDLEMVGYDEMGREIYIRNRKQEEKQSEIL